jgi:hypothetical protein
MTPKQTALLQVSKLLALAVVSGILVNAAFTYFTLTQIGIGFCIGMLAYMIKMYYDMALFEAERLEELNNLKG